MLATDDSKSAIRRRRLSIETGSGPVPTVAALLIALAGSGIGAARRLAANTLI
jgi:hypothetical protein